MQKRNDFPELSIKEVKRITQLLQEKKIRDREKCFVVEGETFIKQILRTPEGKTYLKYLVFSKNPPLFCKKPIFKMQDRKLKRLSSYVTHKSLIGVFKIPDFFFSAFEAQISKLSSEKKQLIIWLDNIQDPTNIGTIIRSAAWFGASAVIASNGSCDFFNPKVIRASAGTIFSIPLISSKEESLGSIDTLRKRGYSIFTTSLKADHKSIQSFCSLEKVLLILGNEGSGVSQEILTSIHSKQYVALPGNSNKIESLNVAGAAASLLSLRYLFQQESIKFKGGC